MKLIFVSELIKIRFTNFYLYYKMTVFLLNKLQIIIKMFYELIYKFTQYILKFIYFHVKSFVTCTTDTFWCFQWRCLGLKFSSPNYQNILRNGIIIIRVLYLYIYTLIKSHTYKFVSWSHYYIRAQFV